MMRLSPIVQNVMKDLWYSKEIEAFAINQLLTAKITTIMANAVNVQQALLQIAINASVILQKILLTPNKQIFVYAKVASHNLKYNQILVSLKFKTVLLIKMMSVLSVYKEPG